MSPREFGERDIHLAIDGELPADDRAAFDSWLAANPEMAARARRYEGDMQDLRLAASGIAEEPVPPRFSALLTSPPPPASAARRPWRMLAAASVLLVLGLGAGYFVGTKGWLQVDPQGVRLADSAIAAHDVYAAEKLHVVEVGADQRDHLVGWLSKRLGTTLVTPDLTAHGYTLVGGRLLPQGSQKAAQFMYEDRSGNRISLYVARNAVPRDTGFRFVQEGSTRAVFWMEDDYGCAVAGAVADGTLTAIADDAYRQLLAGMKG